MSEPKIASKPLKLLREPAPKPPLVDPNETAYEAFKDAENIGRDAKKRQRSSSDFADTDEITKTDHQVVVHNHFHQPQPSVHDDDEPLRVPKKWQPLAALGAGLGAAVIAGLAAALQHCGH